MRISSFAVRILLVMLMVSGFLGLPFLSILQILETGTGEVRFCVRMNPGEEFDLSFIHSVNKSPVHDTLRAQGDHLTIVKSRFDAFGAGMPEHSTDEGELAILPNGQLEWTVNRPTSEIIVRVGRVAQHKLKLKGREIPLAEIAEPGTALTFRVLKVSIFSLLKGGCGW